MTTAHANQAAHREDPCQFVARKIRERGYWEDDPINNLGWLQDEYAEHYGYWVADWVRPCDREAEEAGIRLYGRSCWEKRRPKIILRAHERTCSILIEMGSMKREDGLTDAESAAIDELMASFRKELRGSPIIRQWAHIPYERAHELAVGIFEIIAGGPPHAA